MSTPRGTPNDEKPFCWLSRRALAIIAKHSPKAATMRSVYLALCEIASERGKPSFRTTIGTVARKAGLGYRATWPSLNALATLGLLSIAKPDSSHRNDGCDFTILATNQQPEVMQHVHNCSAPRAKPVMHQMQRGYALGADIVLKNKKNSERTKKKGVSSEPSLKSLKQKTKTQKPDNHDPEIYL
jgi:hypothetical protein